MTSRKTWHQQNHWPHFRRLLKTHLFRKSFPDYLLDINWLSPVDLAVVPLLRPPKNYLIDWLTIDYLRFHKLQCQYYWLWQSCVVCVTFSLVMSVCTFSFQSGLELSEGRGGGLTPQFMSTDAHFWVKIGFKFQSLCKISNISAADPPVLLGQFQHWFQLLYYSTLCPKKSCDWLHRITLTISVPLQ